LRSYEGKVHHGMCSKPLSSQLLNFQPVV
jgi:hypothetical protein